MNGRSAAASSSNQALQGFRHPMDGMRWQYLKSVRQFLVGNEDYAVAGAWPNIENGNRRQILELARDAHRQFERQEPRQKRRLLNFVLSNCTWEDGEVVATFRQPFDFVSRKRSFAFASSRRRSRSASRSARSAIFCRCGPTRRRTVRRCGAKPSQNSTKSTRRLSSFERWASPLRP
jgi:hypothetical protein